MNIVELLRLLEAALLLDERNGVAELARVLAPVATGCAAGNALVVPARLLGDAAVRLGEREQARRYYEQALEAAGKVGFRPEIALTRLALAELLSSGETGARGEVAAHLAFCVPEFAAMGMQPALESARRLLATLRETAGVTARSAERYRYPDGLTEREVAVLRLVAAGKSNREIAATLAISVNTVIRHVEHIFGKIRVSNRVEAAAYAFQHDLNPSTHDTS